MGTSGAWGGSNRQSWNHARELFDTAVGGEGVSGIPSLVQAVVDALIDEDPAALAPATPSDEALLDLPGPVSVSSSGDGGGGGGGGGAVSGVSAVGKGRAGGSSRRRVGRSAGRGGLALGAGYALRRGDAAALSELGLDLAALQGMSPREQRLALLNATLGDANHPDEFALRRAADEFLKEVLTSEPVPDPVELLRDFVAKLIHSLGIVELMRQLDKGAVDAQAAAKKEKQIAAWIKARLRKESFSVEGTLLSLREFQRTAAKLSAT
ncbi:MAG TPA: hypothetical protein VEV82_01790, partial [Actinomycetota bacterium]|nr:hypothetical protein [Actinomycetota bacterium]